MSDAQPPAPVATGERIQSLDVVRGFALLGILLLNILGFGLHSAGYFNPLVPLGETPTDEILNRGTWGAISVLFEGAMRCLFSMLFGAGVVLFTTGRDRAGVLHYRRTFWLFVFGAVDAFILLWTGDILMIYAMAAAILFLMRDWEPRRLIAASLAIMITVSLVFAGAAVGLRQAQAAGDPAWTEFDADFNPSPEAYEEELAARGGTYASAFGWTGPYAVEFLLTIGPLVLVPDAMVMMLLGMALFKMGAMQAKMPREWYVRTAAIGFSVGLAVNLGELWYSVSNGYSTMSTQPFMVPTYQFGRLGMGLGYLSVVMLVCQSEMLPRLRGALAAVGRMALTNYLMHSFICMLLFTGAGLGLVGQLERWELYPVVLAIWVFQLWFSPWWLARYRYGPAEWLWRALTYGRMP